MVAVCPVFQVSQVKKDRKESLACQEFLCQAHRDVQVPPVGRVNQDPPDLQDFPQEQTVSRESPDVPACREREVIQERRAPRVTKAKPVFTAVVAPVPSLDPQDHPDSQDILEVLVAQVPKETQESLVDLVLLANLVPQVFKVLLVTLERKETQVMLSLGPV